jgi:carbonic anhydrase/acetyltransferase-like protein (isoleucine patch superfamily)
MGHPPHRVVLGRDVYVSPTACITGDVVIGEYQTLRRLHAAGEYPPAAAE